jgi:hypothetical protein
MKWQFASARARFGLARALRRGILLAVATGLVAASSAGAVTYPKAHGNGFDRNLQRWKDESAGCNPSLVGLCRQRNSYSAAAGNPKGSIESRMDLLANAGDLFAGTATWRSPSFKATTEGPGTLSYDRQLEVGGLITLQPAATVTDVLVDETSHKSKALGSETLSGANSDFAGHTVVVQSGALTLGHRYHLKLRVNEATALAQAGLLGSITVRFDNVALTLENTGGDGSSGSPGVEFPAPPVTEGEANTLAQQFQAGAGQLPGSTSASRKRCTILGTRRADRIKGTNGNDLICGLGGKDRINGRGGRDIINGGKGNDSLNGSKGKDILGGANGRDRLSGGSGKDRLAGGRKRDRINGGSGRDCAVGARHDRVTRVERRS